MNSSCRRIATLCMALTAASAYAQAPNPSTRAAPAANTPAPSVNTVTPPANTATPPANTAAPSSNMAAPSVNTAAQPAVVPPLQGNPAARANATLGTESGFFKPTPDGSATITGFGPLPPNPPVPQPLPGPLPPGGMATQIVTPQVVVQPLQPDPAVEIRKAEEQADRGEREANRVRNGDTTPPRINGAFTGNTDSRDR